jgi:hypothetical protein
MRLLEWKEIDWRLKLGREIWLEEGDERKKLFQNYTKH